MVSDSQGSTETSEIHGYQKQYVGEGFLVGGAGSSAILRAAYVALPQRSHPDLHMLIEGFFVNQVRPGAAAQVELLVAAPAGERTAIRRFRPGVLTRFEETSSMGAIGSGADFVWRAWRRDQEMGVEWPRRSVADLMVIAFEYADAAHESLTVNDKLMFGVLTNGRTYALGDAQIQATHIPEAIRAAWPMVSTSYREIMELVTLVRDARRQAYRACSRMLMSDRNGAAVLEAQQRLDDQLVGAEVYMSMLAKKLRDYFAWYDERIQLTA